jgi:hypothetical protein
MAAYSGTFDLLAHCSLLAQAWPGYFQLAVAQKHLPSLTAIENHL